MENSADIEESGPTTQSQDSSEKEQQIKTLLKEYNKEYLEFIKVVDQTVPSKSTGDQST